MSKEIAIQKLVEDMKVGELIRFPAGKEEEFIDVERVFLDRAPAWVVYHQEGREIVREIAKIVQLVAEHWSQDLRKVIAQRYTDLLEIIDLGEY